MSSSSSPSTSSPSFLLSPTTAKSSYSSSSSSSSSLSSSSSSLSSSLASLPSSSSRKPPLLGKTVDWVIKQLDSSASPAESRLHRQQRSSQLLSFVHDEFRSSPRRRTNPIQLSTANAPGGSRSSSSDNSAPDSFSRLSQMIAVPKVLMSVRVDSDNNSSSSSSSDNRQAPASWPRLLAETSEYDVEAASPVVLLRNSSGSMTETLEFACEHAMKTFLSRCRHGRVADVLAMLHSGLISSVHVADRMGNTGLLVAAQNGHKSIAKEMLRRGANINAQNVAGNTAMHFCVAFGHLELQRYLQRKGADEAVRNIHGMTCWEGLSPSTSNPPSSSSSSFTIGTPAPLREAAVPRVRALNAAAVATDSAAVKSGEDDNGVSLSQDGEDMFTEPARHALASSVHGQPKTMVEYLSRYGDELSTSPDSGSTNSSSAVEEAAISSDSDPAWNGPGRGSGGLLRRRQLEGRLSVQLAAESSPPPGFAAHIVGTLSLISVENPLTPTRRNSVQ